MLKVDRITSFQNENDVDKMEKKLKLISSSLEIIEEHNIFQLPNFTQLCALSPSFYGQHHFFVSSFCPRGFKYLAFIFIQGGKGVASRAGDNVQYFIVTFQVFVCLLRKGVRTSGQQLAVFCFVFRRPKQILKIQGNRYVGLQQLHVWSIRGYRSIWHRAEGANVSHATCLGIFRFFLFVLCVFLWAGLRELEMDQPKVLDFFLFRAYRICFYCLVVGLISFNLFPFAFVNFCIFRKGVIIWEKMNVKCVIALNVKLLCEEKASKTHTNTPHLALHFWIGGLAGIQLSLEEKYQINVNGSFVWFRPTAVSTYHLDILSSFSFFFIF